MTRTRVTRYAWAAAVVWTGLFVLSAVWNVERTRQETQTLAVSETRAHVSQERAFNLWAAGVGTVYAPVGSRLAPNPALAFRAERDIQSPAGKQLTLVSPHFMLPHADANSAGKNDIRERLTSLNPVDPNKSPDAWEHAALVAFESGSSEVHEVVQVDGVRYLRLMEPLITEERCLACHGRQGYRAGEIRGGLEAWTDLSSYEAASTHEIVAVHVAHGVLWVIGLAGIVVATRRLTQSIAEREQAEVERRQMEVRIQAAQKLESLGVLAGGMAHDFNNLLTGILGHASLALEQLPAGAPVRRLVEKVQRAAERAADLTKQMLAYAGKGAMSVEPVSLNQVVADAADLSGTARAAKAKLEYRLAGDLPAIEADATNIRRIMMNLFTNAAEAVGEKCASIVVTTGVRHCESEYFREPWLHEPLPAGEYVFVEVADTGCGMDAGTLAKIFDPFFTTKFMGRGLGLAAVLGMVRRHGGAIKVESAPGRGSTFRVFFPAAGDTAVPAKRGSAISAASSQSGTVLVADDEPAALKPASPSLHRPGFEMVAAPDERAAAIRQD